MLIHIPFENNKESNLFLRALCSEFRERCGKCAWQYMPYRVPQENLVCLGIMSINRESNVTVSVRYKKRGVIEKLEFTDGDGKELSIEMQKLINNVIDQVKEKYKQPNNSFVQFSVKSLAEFSGYSTENFSIHPIGNCSSSIIFRVEGYDNKDRQYIGEIKRKRICDIMSVLTNLPLYSGSVGNNPDQHMEEVFWEEDDYIDGYPIKNGYVLLPTYAISFIDMILCNDKEVVDDKLYKLLNAAGHFHAGRKFDSQITDRVLFTSMRREEDTIYLGVVDNENNIEDDVLNNIYEMAIVSYISTLEVLATIVEESEPVKCECCGQLVYSISNKVKTLLIKYFGEFQGKEIHKYYASRSKFLHTGRRLSRTYVGVSIPQLDSNSISGAELIEEISLLNLREYVGYCFRGVIKEYFLRG